MEKKSQNARMITQNFSFNEGKNGFGVICYIFTLLEYHCVFQYTFFDRLHHRTTHINFWDKFFKHKK